MTRARRLGHAFKEALMLGLMPQAGLAPESECLLKHRAQGILLASREVQTEKDEE